MGVQQAGANLARANVQTANELLKHRAAEVTDNGLMGHMAQLGTSIESYRASVGLPPLAGQPTPASSPNPPLDMSAPAPDNTALPGSSAPSAAPPTDMSLEEYPFDPETGDMLSPEQIAARKKAPSAAAPTPTPDSKPTLASAGLAVPKLDGQSQPSAPPATTAPQTPDLSVLDRLEETRAYVMATTAPNSRERADGMKSVMDMERIVLAQPGILQAKAQWEAAKVTQAQQREVETIASQLTEAQDLGMQINLPPTVKLEGGKLILAKTGTPLSLNQAQTIAKIAFSPTPASSYDPAKDKELQIALTAVRLNQRPEYQASLTTPEEKAKAKQEFEKAQAQLEVLATTSPDRARIIMAATAQPDPTTEKNKDKSKEGGDTTPPPPPQWIAPAERAAAAEKAKVETAAAAQWTAAKEAFTADIPTAELEGAAMATAEGRKVKTGETRQLYASMAGPGPLTTSGAPEPVIGSPARALLVAQGINPDQKQKVGEQEFTAEQILTERLKEIAVEKGFVASGQDAPLQSGQAIKTASGATIKRKE
jgi:hypothetical protein